MLDNSLGDAVRVARGDVATQERIPIKVLESSFGDVVKVASGEVATTEHISN